MSDKQWTQLLGTRLRGYDDEQIIPDSSAPSRE